jgi:hypothetical protein
LQGSPSTTKVPYSSSEPWSTSGDRDESESDSGDESDNESSGSGSDHGDDSGSVADVCKIKNLTCTMILTSINHRALQVAPVLQMKMIPQAEKEIQATRSAKATAIAPHPPPRLDPHTPLAADLNHLFYNNRHSQSGRQILIRYIMPNDYIFL